MTDKDSSHPIISPTRTKATWKPGVSNDPVPFFRCGRCGTVLVGVDGAHGAVRSGNPRRPDIKLPFATNEFSPTCCGIPMERLQPIAAEGDDALALSYEVVGGFDMNTLRVTLPRGTHGVRWVALKTFTGMQLKYVLPEKQGPVVFALGDEDAYAYCNEDPCLACTFRCKRGFELYAFLDDCGLIATPLHRENFSPNRNS